MAKGKFPAFQFYPDAWLSSSSVTLMTPAEEGAYLRLLCHAWQSDDCGLPDDDDALAELSRLRGQWKKSAEKIRAKFQSADGRLFNTRLTEERQKQLEWRSKSAEGGKKSGKIRSQSKGGLRVVQPPFTNGSQLVGGLVGVNDEPNTNISSSSSFSVKAKNKDPTEEQYDSTTDWPKFSKIYPSHRINEYMDLRVWMGVVTSADMAARIVAKVEKFKRSVKWADPQYIPSAAKFLGERIFDTDPGPSAPAPRTPSDVMAEHRAMLREITGGPS